MKVIRYILYKHDPITTKFKIEITRVLIPLCIWLTSIIHYFFSNTLVLACNTKSKVQNSYLIPYVNTMILWKNKSWKLKINYWSILLNLFWKHISGFFFYKPRVCLIHGWCIWGASDNAFANFMSIFGFSRDVGTPLRMGEVISLYKHIDLRHPSFIFVHQNSILIDIKMY